MSTTYEKFKNRYQFSEENRIKKGGFSKVFQAFDTLRKRYVAIKVSPVTYEHNISLESEVEKVREVDYHVNLAKYENFYRFKIGEFETDYAVLKYYEHGDLGDYLRKNAVTEKEKDKIILGILNGVKHLHREDIIHRDLKCGNILIEVIDGEIIPKITDFGLGRIYVENKPVINSIHAYTTEYASPEQIILDKIDRTTDIWSLGVIIYRICAGELPFLVENFNNNQEYIDKLKKKVRSLDLNYKKLNSIVEPYQTIIKRCLVIEPGERAQSVDELIEQLTIKKINYPNGNVYEGQMLNGLKHGKGKFIWVSGDVYEGDWKDGKRTGMGKYTWADGDVYEGGFLNGESTGKGKYTYRQREIHLGKWKNLRR